MEYKAIVSSKNKDFLSTFKELLGGYFSNYEIFSDEVIQLIVNDEPNFIFTLKQIQTVLFEDYLITCSILVVPFFHSMFNKYVTIVGNNTYTLYDVLIKHLDEDYVKKDMEEVIDFLGKDAIDTLSSYIDNNCDANRTALELFLHRNSFAYRLKNIVLKTGFEYNDVNSLMLIKLCISLKG